MFVVLDKPDGSLEVITPPLTGSSCSLILNFGFLHAEVLILRLSTV